MRFVSLVSITGWTFLAFSGVTISAARAAEDLSIETGETEALLLTSEDDAENLLVASGVANDLVDPAMSLELENSVNLPSINPFRRFAWELDFTMLGSHLGLSVGVRTPFFWNEWVAFRVLGGVNWVTGVPKQSVQGLEVWNSMLNARGALVVGHPLGATSPWFLYGYAGPMIGLPSERLTETGAFFGYFGGVGIESFLQHARGISLFLEAGGVGSVSRAERYEGDPALSSGLMALVGFRCPF